MDKTYFDCTLAQIIQAENKYLLKDAINELINALYILGKNEGYEKGYDDCFRTAIRQLGE